MTVNTDNKHVHLGLSYISFMSLPNLSYLYH